MRLKLSNPLFRILLGLMCLELTANTQEGFLLYGAEESEREITLILQVVNLSDQPIAGVKISVVGKGEVGTTNEKGELKIDPLKVQSQTLLLECQKEGYLKKTKVLRLTHPTKREFTQKITLEREEVPATEGTKTPTIPPRESEKPPPVPVKIPDTPKEEVITLSIPKEKISQLASGLLEEVEVSISPEAGELQKAILQRLSGESERIEISIGRKGDQLIAHLRLPAPAKTEMKEPPQEATPNEKQPVGVVTPSDVSSGKDTPPRTLPVRVIDTDGGKRAGAVVKVDGIDREWTTDQNGETQLELPAEMNQIQIKVSKEGYEQVDPSHNKEIDLQRLSSPLEIQLKRLPTVDLTIQVEYQEGLLFSMPETNLKSNFIPKELRDAFASNGITLVLPNVPLVEDKKNTYWLVGDKEQKYIVRKENKRLSIYQPNKPVVKALVQINDEEGKTVGEDGSVTLPNVSVPTSGKLKIKVSKGLMEQEKEYDIGPSSLTPTIPMPLAPKQWIEITVRGRNTELLPNIMVNVDDKPIEDKIDQNGKLIIPANLDTSSEHTITFKLPDGTVKKEKLPIRADQKVYPVQYKP